MAEAVTIQVEARDPAKNKGTGSRVARKLRKQGRVPAIIYGHKQTPQPVSLAKDDVAQMIKNHSHIANLKFGDATEMVMVRDIQWDHLGQEILHLDFARVSADERIETTVPLELYGVAPGTSEGGVLEFVIHELTVSCPATSIPDLIRVPIGELHLNQGVHVKDLKLPEGVEAVDEPDLLLVHVVTPRAAAETAAEPGATSVEPEVIGRKPEDKDKADAKEEKKK